MFKKLAIGLVVGGALVGIAHSQEVPFDFQKLFFIFALIGAVVFMMLDAPPIGTMSGGKSVFAVTAFWILLITACIAGAALLPQFNPEDERAKIDKLLGKERSASQKGKAEELIARAKALDEQVKALEERLKGLGGGQAASASPAPPAGDKPSSTAGTAAGGGGDFMKVGEEQWQLQECYNCHKLRGEGGKKRGPELDNIGSFLTVEEIQQKIYDPKSIMAEGYEKEWQKGIMPDKFKDLMEPKEMQALAAWLGTFKNTSVNTPKPIKKKIMLQPKLKSKVRCTDLDIGEVTKVVLDPLSHEISHIVVSMNGSGERQVAMGHVQAVTDDVVQLRAPSTDILALPPFKREDYVTTHEVEISHLEDNIHVTPGEVLVPLPDLEKSVKRRTFFMNFTHVIGFLVGLPIAYPILRYLMKPMYADFDNDWLKVGNVSKIKQDDVGVQFKYKKKVKEVYMPESEIDKNVWILRATPELLEKVYKDKDMEFRDAKGKTIWANKRDIPYVAFSGKCPHLGCAFKWRQHKTLGQVFLCPCHLSIYDAAGKVLDGPAPRGLDALPMKVSAAGDVEIIDMEFKAGTKSQIRII